MMDLRYTGGPAEQDINRLFSRWMEEMLNEDEKVVYLDADLMRGLNTADLWKKRPDRVYNCGIQEGNMVAVAAGLCLAGYKPYVHSFTPFVTRRAYDQIAVSVAYAHKSVHLIGTDAGILASDNGGTHMCFEDVAIIRAIPEACVIDVTDAAMFHALLRNTKDRSGVTYFRTGRRNMPDVYLMDTEFEVGRGKVLTEGTDVTVIASGIMVASALEAAKALRQEGIRARVVDPVTIKPLDEPLVLKCAAETGAIVSAENCNVIGGLGSAVAELVCRTKPVPVVRVGVEDQFGQTGPVGFLREAYGLTPERIIEGVREALCMKGR